MKVKIVLLFFCFSLSLYGQNRNYDQELADILYAEKLDVFHAIDFYNLYKDSLQFSFSKDSYEVITDLYLNRFDSALVHIPLFIKKYEKDILPDELKSQFFNLLLMAAQNSGNYKMGLEVLDEIKLSVESSPMHERDKEVNLQIIEGLRENYQKMIHFPFRLTNNAPGKDVEVALDTIRLVQFDAQVNEVFLPVTFDTGAGYPLVMSKETADKISLKMLEEYQTKTINGIQTQSAFGILDSLRIGSLLLENISVYVFEGGILDLCLSDSIHEKKHKFVESDYFQVILGLPLIRLLNHVQLDMENQKMIISLEKKDSITQFPNMYINNQLLYVGAQINNKKFTMFWDTGGEIGDKALMITEDFYRNNLSNSTPLDFGLAPDEANTINVCGAEGITTYYYKKPEKLQFQVGIQTVDLANESMVLVKNEDSNISRNIKDGFMGFGFLTRVKRITFDFHAMQMHFIP